MALSPAAQDVADHLSRAFDTALFPLPFVVTDLTRDHDARQGTVSFEYGGAAYTVDVYRAPCEFDTMSYFHAAVRSIADAIADRISGTGAVSGASPCF